ncbi:hypothetical protein E8E12_008897 [Didymella heteroderae]|uniref:Heterokaryon incompatibility domain-containing protein n=1 Tax=Didymella heteroderae TaxID=1769908 RepID=A0A9P5C1Y6_9PLEO|nr:hypothetical protein E8E12_008897 [Didymella heteroderae]
MAAEDEAAAIELNERASDFLPDSMDSDLWAAWDGIAEMFTSQYFTRLWIVQEATTPTGLSSKKCTDPLDRVFSALGLAKDVPAGQITIDYWANIVDVYSHAARTLISDSATSLGVLGACFAPVINEPPLQSELPSWVPDWRQSCMISGLSASVNSRDRDEFFYTPYPGPVGADFDGAKLKVAGIIMHSVQITTVTKPWDDDFHSWSTALGWYGELMQHRETSSDFEIGLLRSFVGDRWLVSYEEDEALFLWGRGGTMDSEAPKQDARLLDMESTQWLLVVHHLLATVCFTRKMALLSSSQVAVLPAAAKIGNKIAAFRGGHALDLIRTPPNRDEYHFVGECYVDGWMDGQVVRDGEHAKVETITMI